MTCRPPGRSMWPRWWRGEVPSCLRTSPLLRPVHQVRAGGRYTDCFPHAELCKSHFPSICVFILCSFSLSESCWPPTHSVVFLTVPPSDERNRLWMVEAEISPEMIKRKKKKKKRKKEARQVEEAADRQREFGHSSVPRLPKLPCHPSLVANLQEQQRQQRKLEDEVLPGSYPEVQPSHPLSREQNFPYPSYQSSRYSYGRSHPPTFNDRPEDLGLGPRCLPSASTWQPSGPSSYPGETDLTGGLSERLAHVARVPAGRRAGYGPIHSRTNLMEAELMDADSDF